MCLIQDVIYRKKVLKLKLNSIWNKIYKLLPSKVDLKLSLGGPLAIGVWKHGVMDAQRFLSVISSLQHAFI